MKLATLFGQLFIIMSLLGDTPAFGKIASSNQEVITVIRDGSIQKITRRKSDQKELASLDEDPYMPKSSLFQRQQRSVAF